MERVLCVLGAALLSAALLFGCNAAGGNEDGGSSNAPEGESPNAANGVSSSSASVVASSNGQEKSDNPPSSTAAISTTQTYSLSPQQNHASLQSRVFEDGVAWMALRKSGSDDRLGLINEQGDVLYILDEGKFSTKVENIVSTPFVKGLSAIYPERHPGFVVVDSKGREVYSSDDDSLYLYGQADDGNFILLKHDAGFDRDTWAFCLLNPDFKLTETGIETTSDTISRKASQGDPTVETIESGALYNLDGTSFLNLENGSWFTSTTLKYHGKHGDCLCVDHYGYVNGGISGMFYIPISLFKKASSAEDVTHNLLGDSSCIKLEPYDYDVLADKYIPKAWHGGSFLHTKENGSAIDYVDIRNATLLQFPSYPADTSYRKIDDFSGGFSALYLIGVDEQGYVALINEDGVEQYDPTPAVFSKYTAYSYYENNTCSCNGYVFMWDSQNVDFDVVSPKGEHKRIGDDLSGLENARFVSLEGPSIAIGGGFIFTNQGKPRLVSVDGKTSVDTVRASFNSKGELVAVQS